MMRSVLAGGVAALIGLGNMAVAQDQAPALSPPVLIPPLPAPAQTPPASARPTPEVPARPSAGHSSGAASRPGRAPAPAENRPLLVIPGVTAPAPPATRPTLRPSLSAAGAPADSAAQTPGADRLSSSLPEVLEADAPTVTSEPSPTRRGAIPLTLESIPDDAPGESGAEAPRSSRPSASRTGRFGESGSSEEQRNRPLPLPPARGPSNFFGRLFAPLAPRQEPATPRSSVSVEPHSNPEAEAVMKRRIEKQVQQAVGDRVRSVEIRVTGRTVQIRAQASRFWLRRGVRRSLETLTMPSGYHARVEMID